MSEIKLNPIGYVRNKVTERKQMTGVGVKSSIIINEKYLPAVEYLNENSHIIVMCYFNQAKRDVLTVFPKKFGFTYHIEKGVFATRSPDRPNPISSTIVKLLEIDHNEIIVERLDAIEGTPVIDIKPYSYGSDCIFNTQSVNVKNNFADSSDEMLYEYIKLGTLNYVYSIDDSLELGIFTILKLIREINEMPDRRNIDYVETNYSGNALDSLYYFLKFTPGEKKLRILNNNDSENSFFKAKLSTGQFIELKQNGEKLLTTLTP